MFYRLALNTLSYLMGKAPLPIDLAARVRAARLNDRRMSDGAVLLDGTVFALVMPGQSILMAALANAIYRKNQQALASETDQLQSELDSSPVRYLEQALVDSSNLGSANQKRGIKPAWVNWNDLPMLNRAGSLNSRTVLIPVQIFERRGPSRSNPRYSFGFWRSLEFLVFRRRSAILLGEAISIGGPETDGGERSVSRIVRLLKLDRLRSLRQVRGVPFQSQRVQEEQVLSGPEFERETALLAQKLKLPSEHVNALARREFRTISANPVRWIFTVSAAIARLIIRQLFSEVTIVGMKQFAEATKDAAVVLVPMHRSHLDYILVGSVLYESRLNTPVVAAGLNLSFWPVGPVIRSLGAYFVKRNSRNDRVHSLVLKRYVAYLTKRGHLQEFFIEGGRSRSGRMRAPKVGLLNIMVDTCAKGLRKELLFVPVSISYENVVEERALAEENTGIKKRSESLRDLLSVHRVFRRNYGEVVLQFGRPLSLSAMLGRVIPGQGKARPDTRTIVRELANALIGRLRAQSSVSMSGLICTALLSAPRYGLSSTELERRLILLAKLASLARLKNPELGAFTHTLELFLERPEGLQAALTKGSTIFKVKRVLNEEIVFIPGGQRYRADFYRNASHHVFFPLAVVAANQRLEGGNLYETAGMLHAAFEREFLLGSREEFIAEITGLLEVLETEGMAQRGSDGDDWTLSEEVLGLGLDNLVLVPIESVLWVAERLANHNRPVGYTASYKEFVSQAQAEFRAAAYRPRGIPSRTEAGSQSNITGALEILESLEIIEIQEGVTGPTNIVVKSEEHAPLLKLQRLAEGIQSGSLRALRESTRSPQRAR